MAALDPNKPELDFVARTRQQVENYKDKYEFTNLLNCMLGLIIVPREKQLMLQAIPDDPISDINWVDAPPRIDWGTCRSCKEATRQTIKNLVIKVRNAVAHFAISFVADDAADSLTWKEVVFKAHKDFEAVFTFGQLKCFALYVCDRLLDNPAK